MRWLLVLVLGFAAVGPAPADPIPVRAFFGPKPADDPDGLLPNLLKFLDTAKTTLHASCHEVDMILVAEKLAERAAAGVEVRVVVESQWWAAAKNKAARQVLERSKVVVIPDAKKSGLMHHKFFVADGTRVWTGSTNLTETCLLYNPNNSVWVEGPAVAALFEAEFAGQAAGKPRRRTAADRLAPLPPAVRLDADTAVTALFSPGDGPVRAVVERIDGARESVDVACFVFSSKAVGEAVKAAHARGVTVRVLLDNVFASPRATARWKYVPFNELTAAGVACKYDDEASKLHHKVVIVDRKVVVTGSFNLSASAAADNNENMLVIESPAVAKRYAAEFDRLWALYHGDPGDVPPLEPGDADASR